MPGVIEVRSPADGTVAGRVPVQSADDVATKVSALRLHQPEWEAIGGKGRKAWMLKYQDWLLDNTKRIADVIQSETAKPRVDAEIEAPAIADVVGYCARRAEEFMADAHPIPMGF